MKIQQPKKKLTLKEKLQRSLMIKKNNLEKKRQHLAEVYKVDMDDVNEKLEVVELQLSGLKK